MKNKVYVKVSGINEMGMNNFNLLFRNMLKESIKQDFMLHLDINLVDKFKTKLINEDRETFLTVGKCTCGLVQLVNGARKCYLCGKTFSKHKDLYSDDCVKCGHRNNIYVQGGVSYITCNKCNTKNYIYYNISKRCWESRKNNGQVNNN